MTQFVILAVPRTGSNLLCTLLNSHPEILCHHEVFNPQGIFVALTHRNGGIQLGTRTERDRDPLAFLDRVWLTGRDYRCVGFKWTRGQNKTVFESVLEDSGIKKIVLRRGNRIKTYISEQIAEQTRQWEAYSQQELHLSRPSVTVDNVKLLEHISLNRQFYTDIGESLRRTHQPHIDVLYESLFSPQEQQRLLEFLGVNIVDQRLTAASVKQNSTDLRDSIANFSELSATLVGSDLETDLYDREM
jgi:LPS sulfotransferase NodH